MVPNGASKYSINATHIHSPASTLSSQHTDTSYNSNVLPIKMTAQHTRTLLLDKMHWARTNSSSALKRLHAWLKGEIKKEEETVTIIATSGAVDAKIVSLLWLNLDIYKFANQSATSNVL